MKVNQFLFKFKHFSFFSNISRIWIRSKPEPKLWNTQMDSRPLKKTIFERLGLDATDSIYRLKRSQSQNPMKTLCRCRKYHKNSATSSSDFAGSIKLYTLLFRFCRRCWMDLHLSYPPELRTTEIFSWVTSKTQVNWTTQFLNLKEIFCLNLT